MFAGLGSYISRGVSTVSRPLQPFGGAIDVIVVKQPDGTLKSGPWYVRYGKSQPALKPSEKVITINVNGVEADFHMYLDNSGEAYFLREIDGEAGEVDSYPSSCGDDDILSPRKRRIQKSKSWDYDASGVDLVSELAAANDNMLARTNSRRGGLFGLSFGRRSGDSQENGGFIETTTSLERAEMAADLLEVRWTTNLGKGEKWNSNPQQIPKPNLPVPGAVGKVSVEDAPHMKNSLVNGANDNKVGSSLSCEVNGPSCAPGSKQSNSNKETDAEISCSVNPETYVEAYAPEETRKEVDNTSNGSEISHGIDNVTIDKDRNAQSNSPEVSVLKKVSCRLESQQNEGCHSSGEERSSNGNVPGVGSFPEIESGINNVESSMSYATEENVTPQLDECRGPSNESVLVAGAGNAPRGGSPTESGGGTYNVESSVSRATEENVIPELDKCSEQSNGSVVPKQGVDTKEDNVEHLARCNGDDKTLGNITQSENSEDELFSFSDIDDRKSDKVDQVGVSFLHYRKGCLPKDSPESSEDEVTETTIIARESHPAIYKLIQDDQVIISPSAKYKSKGVSSPISIPKHQNNAEEELIAPIAESLPSMHQVGIPQPLSRSLDSNLDAMKMVDDDAQDYSKLGVHSTPKSLQISEEIKSIVSDPAVEVSLCRHLLYEGMGYEAATVAFDAEKLDKGKFASLGPDIVKDEKLVVRIGGLYFPWDAALPIAAAIGSQAREQALEAKGMIAVGQADKTSGGASQRNMNARNGSWRLWPFSFKKTNNSKNIASDSASADPVGNDRNAGKDETTEKDGNTQQDRSTGKDGNTAKDGITEKDGDKEKGGSKKKDGNAEKGGNKDVARSKVMKKKIRAKTPTSEQVASLKLKDGKNIVTFSFCTAALGNQQIDARIFLWKWDTRIVISDVDGTITKSDVLGHVMPMMGMDWSQTGVTHLFTAIKENGYQLLFLSARSILQATTTRQFLINLKQDGNALPEGPIVISPDGLFPSLYREVIRRAPHEFKISCLEDIKALFPRDHNPFYAGFGNRDTDELSYLKVGIPKGKIFTINPKGEVAVNRRIDTKSYTSLHALVHDMFPETPVMEQEDYNSWNFWRLPPPDVGI